MPHKTRSIIALLMAVFCMEVQALEVKGFEPDKSAVYKTVGGTELKIHIFNPEMHKPSDSRPGIVFFFGGGWNSGSPSQFYPHCEHLASLGMVAMAAEYRVKTKHGTTPQECVKDGKSAIRWIRQNAKDLGIDPDKVLAGGGSAGGHVAAAAAMTEGFNEKGEDLAVSCVPAALVLFNPVYDNGPGGYGHDRVKEYWKQISPMHNIGEKTPPTIVMFGSKDNLVSPDKAAEYKRLMEEKGRRCDLHIYEGQGHGFFNYQSRKNYTETVADMDRFLQSLGYLSDKSKTGELK